MRARSLVAFILALLVSNASCTSSQVAVGVVIAGGGSLVGSRLSYRDNCSDEGCHLLTILLGAFGVVMVAGGGIVLATQRNSTD